MLILPDTSHLDQLLLKAVVQQHPHAYSMLQGRGHHPVVSAYA